MEVSHAVDVLPGVLYSPRCNLIRWNICLIGSSTSSVAEGLGRRRRNFQLQRSIQMVASTVNAMSKVIPAD